MLLCTLSTSGTVSVLDTLNQVKREFMRNQIKQPTRVQETKESFALMGMAIFAVFLIIAMPILAVSIIYNAVIGFKSLGSNALILIGLIMMFLNLKQDDNNGINTRN